MDATSLFEKLKKSPKPNNPTKTKINHFFFQIEFDDYGAFLSVVDEKLNLQEVDYHQYSGAKRELLRNLAHIQDKSAFVIDWEKDSENIYLSDYDYLLWQLKLCDNVVDAKGKKIQFQETETHLKLLLEEQEENEQSLIGKVTLQNSEIATEEDIQMLTESYILAGQKVFQTNPIGNNFNNLNFFNTTFAKDTLEKYLTLFVSYFQNIDIHYQNYETLYSDAEVAPEPSIFFEKIDDENSLYLRISQALPHLEPDFLDNYDVDRLAFVNEMEQHILIKVIRHQPIQGLVEQVKKIIGSKKKASLFQDENLLIIPEELAVSFIRKSLPQLLTEFQVFGAEKLKSYKITAVTPKLSFNISHGIDFLEGDASLDIEGEQYSLFDVINQYNKQRYVQLNDGTQAVLNEKYIKRLERLFKKQKDGTVKVSFFDMPLVEDLIEEKVANEAFERSREVFTGFNQIKSNRFKAPKAVNAKLRPYQQQGFKWLDYLHDKQLGGCLADDMGLGKTLQTITLLSKIYPKEKKPSLIVMPKSLLFNWGNEVEKFNPNLTFYTYYAQNRDLKEALKHQLIFTTYAILRNDIQSFKEESFYYVILDESQNIKNLMAQTTKAVMLLNSQHRLALSGTPVENNLTELFSLFRFLNPAMFTSLDEFNQYYTHPIQNDNDKEVASELRRKIYPFILRRLKKNVLKELPPKVEQVLYVEMSPQQKKLYEERRQSYYESLRTQIGKEGINKSQFFILQALTELRQIASTPESRSDGKIISAKREALMENVLDAASNGHKCLIFASFLNAIEVIGEELAQAGIDYVAMTGATQNRQKLIEKFQNDKKCRVFLMTLKTGGVGLNLTAADMVYIYDPWWNVAAENQAIDRTHRMGQKKTVFSYKLITKGTIEEKILQLQEQKKELFDNIIASDSASIKSLSEDDIEFMLG